MPNITELWKKRPNRLGVEIDARSLRVVRLERTQEAEFEIAECGSLNVSLKSSSQQDQQRIRAFLKQMSGGLTHIAANIEDSSLRIRQMSFAKMPDRDLIEAIRWHFREHIDSPIEDYQVGYTQIEGWGDPEKPSYTAFGISHKAVKDYLEMIRQTGFKAAAIEPQVTALLAAFDHNLSWEPKHTYVCISLGEEVTHFIVMADAQLLFSRPMAGISCNMLSKLISRNLRVDQEKASEIIANCFDEKEGLNTNQFTGDVATTMSQFYSQLVIETQRSIDAFCIMFNVDRVDSIYICGIGAYCPQIVDHMQTSLGIRTQLFDPFSCMGQDRLDERLKSHSAMFAVSVGLAIP